MDPEDTDNAEDDPLAQFARIIYEQMDIEPRRMHVAIELAKQHMAEIRQALVKEGLRSESDDPESTRLRENS